MGHSFYIAKCKTDLIKSARDQQDLARILASQATHSADWFVRYANIISLGLRLNVLPLDFVLAQNSARSTTVHVELQVM